MLGNIDQIHFIMKSVVKVGLTILSLFIVIVIIGISYLTFALPNVDDPEPLVVEGSEAQVQHGRYLANHVMVCMDCHSERDWSKFSGPIRGESLGKGGETFNEDQGFPGSFYSKNITPYALASWTDGEIFRAITTGVSKDGNALFPVMPYSHYGTIDRKDIEAIIAYLRTIPAIESENKVSKANFPMNFILNTLPKNAEFIRKPEKSN